MAFKCRRRTENRFAILGAATATIVSMACELSRGAAATDTSDARIRQSLRCKICQKVTLTVNRYFPSICFPCVYSNILSEFPSKRPTVRPSVRQIHVLFLTHSPWVLISRAEWVSEAHTWCHYWAILGTLKGTVFDYTSSSKSFTRAFAKRHPLAAAAAFHHDYYCCHLANACHSLTSLCLSLSPCFVRVTSEQFEVTPWPFFRHSSTCSSVTCCCHRTNERTDQHLLW